MCKKKQVRHAQLFCWSAVIKYAWNMNGDQYKEQYFSLGKYRKPMYEQLYDQSFCKDC